MALSTTARKVIHDGNGSASVFPFTFPILDASHLSVIYTDAADVETTLSPSLYTVTGIGSLTGGNVTYLPPAGAIATGTKLTIVRTVPNTQLTVFSNQGGYYPETIENRFDLIYMKLQEFQEELSRVVLGSISDPATEQSNLALIQLLQAFEGDIDKLTTAGDMLSHNGSAYIRLARGAAGQYLGVSGTALAWQTPVIFSTGDAKITLKTVADSGWVLANDGTIGSAGSGATTRANADTAALYALLWDNVSDTYAPVTGGRGANAAADFAADKPIALLKVLGRALAIAGAGSTLTSRALGETLGAETHTLSVAEMPAHSHPGTNYGNAAGGTVIPPGSTGGAGAAISVAPQGGGGAHNNMQPTSFFNLMIKL